MRIFGLIGFPLTHSFSKGYFTEKFRREHINEVIYENFEIETIGLLRAILKSNPGLRGLNVTIPHKQAVIGLLDEMDGEAAEIGAVNTIRISSGKLKGYNTDHIGFSRSLQPFLKSHHKKALVLGTGGSSRAVKYSLKKSGIEFKLVSRTPTDEDEIGYEALDQEILNQHYLIINTTPLGMFPNTGTSPDIPFQHVGKHHLLFDLIYNPEETAFLQRGKHRGADILNGRSMLEFQAEEAWRIWSEF